MTSSKSKSNEPYDEFYASVKLTSGEEVLAMVIVDTEGAPDKIVLDSPVVCKEVRSFGTNTPVGYKFEPWMKMSDDTTYLIPMEKVITISQINTPELIETYKEMISGGFEQQDHPDISKEMGYVSTVDNARSLLEKIYDSEPYLEDQS